LAAPYVNTFVARVIYVLDTKQIARSRRAGETNKKPICRLLSMFFLDFFGRDDTVDGNQKSESHHLLREW